MEWVDVNGSLPEVKKDTKEELIDEYGFPNKNER